MEWLAAAVCLLLCGYAALMCLMGGLSTVAHAIYAAQSGEYGNAIGYTVVAIVFGIGGTIVMVAMPFVLIAQLLE